jgi:glutathione-regulated potassium-efflux system protein KefB
MDFFLYLLAFLTAGLFFVFLFTRLGLGPILGYLVAGITIGPYILGIVREPDFLREVSELGLVFFLFLIGLELSPKRVWHMRRAVFVLGPAQLLVTGICLSALSYIWLKTIGQSLVIGLSLTLSSTAIGLQLLSEKNEVTSPEGQNSLGILIFQDLAVIPFLAVLPFLATQGINTFYLSTFSWTTLLTPIATVAAVIFSGIYVIPHGLRFLARVNRQELFVAASLVLVIGVAVLMRSVGLSMGLGAFLGGVLLANSEFRHEIQADIEPFKALLFGLFFISMGASLDLKFLEHSALPLIVATVSLLFIKTASNFAALYGMGVCSKRAAIKIAALLGQAGEFALVALGVAAGFKIINQDISTFCIGVVGLSMALASPWYKTFERVLKKIKEIKSPKPEYNVVSENPEVIIAGYGRFGQIVHRILRLHEISVTILDSNHEQVEFVKKYGTKVFFGDPTRLDLLKTAGADTARLFVLAIDQPAASARTAEIIKENFPNLPVFARARNREHSLRLMSLGIPQKHIVRELLYSSLNLTEDILQHLGMSYAMASQTIHSFLEHDQNVLAAQVQYLDKEEEMIKFTTQSAKELQKIFESDRKESSTSKMATSVSATG